MAETIICCNFALLLQFCDVNNEFEMTTKRLTVTIGVFALGVVVGGLAMFLCRDKAGSTVADSPDAVAVAVENDTFPQVYGIDVSYYQGNIFWDKLWLPCSENGVVSGRVPVPEKLRAVQFAFIRATMGDTLADLFYYKNYQEANRADIPCGSYHFLTDGVSGKTQAEWFLAHARLEPGDLPPVLDMEMKSPAMVQRAKEWLEVVEKECGTQAIIYTNMNLYSMFVKTDTMLSNRTVWLAKIMGDRPEEPNCLFWQFTHQGHVCGIVDNVVDINMFNGTPADFQQYVLAKGIKSAKGGETR